MGATSALLISFFRLILNTFFRSIKVRGAHKIPATGPVIFAVAPHANQFVDPMLLAVTCGRSVGFLAAKKSMDKFWIGLFGRAMNSIPVERAQDKSITGSGTLYMPDESDPYLLHGHNTEFTKQIKSRSSASLPNNLGVGEVAEVISDTELRLSKPLNTLGATACLRCVDECGKVTGSPYSIIPHLDQSKMFSEVTQRLVEHSAVGIFPEGGSHDRPEMLPLKAGVAIMALDAAAKHPDLPIKIVPSGLSYFHADKFRSRAVIEYGDAIEIPIELVELYKKGGADKRHAINTLLDTIIINLKSFILQAPDFETLMVVQAVRRLYTPVGRKLDVEEALAISRNFAEGYTMLRENPKVQALTRQVLEYNRLLKYYGVLDHQVKNTNISSIRALPLLIYRVVEMLVLFTLALPVLILFSPLIILSRIVSHQKAAEALAGSSVKIAGKDVVTTWKLLTAMIVIPTLSVIYIAMAFVLSQVYIVPSSFTTSLTISAVTAITLPILGFATIRISDIGMDILKSLSPLVVSLVTPERSTKTLRVLRAELTASITAIVVELGPKVIPDFEAKRVVSEKEALLSIEAASLVKRNDALEISTDWLGLDTSFDESFALLTPDPK
ncbi:hypothetical protein BASA61_000190 [Batrachochytrium salamandrivorans]|nr:hypothetical protein BASA62_000065 [Batrachochytrium salamandrivorans]KAH6573056.1 hypothetical protein BASA60_006223 [Batrachochytrium salamandrivorans]KAH6578432.1 hypothetical protein BASA61_000190 [Batrachochytrium salamandrivorans]